MPCSSNIVSEDYADFILEYYFYSQNVASPDLMECAQLINNQFAIVHIPLSEVQPFTIEEHSYSSIPKLYTILDSTSMEASGIVPAIGQPYLETRGQGIIVGFIDTGIDYQNPAFRMPDGSSRIIGIWDQTIEPATPPPQEIQRFAPYGTEFTKEDINAALRSDSPLSLVPTTDDNGHGTFIAGIAAGSEIPEQDFVGASPDCQIGFVKLKPAKRYLRDFYLISEDAVAYQENDIMSALKYLISLSSRYSMPLVICISVGTNWGSHNGTSPLAELLNALSFTPGIVTVVAAGNETGYGHHYFGTIPQGSEYEDVELRVAAGERGFVMELWGREPELYTVGFVSPTGETIARIPNVPRGSDQRITFLLEPTVITINYQITDIGSGSLIAIMHFRDPTPGIWKIRVYNSLFINGQYHIWLPVHGFLSQETYFLRPSPDTTITEPGNASSPITVSTYDHRDNSIYIHSSRGFTRFGAIKPDIAAPGVDIVGPGLTPRVPSALSSFPTTTKSGSSIAAAHTAGAAADLLSWAFTAGNSLSMNTSIAKAYLIRGAVRSDAYNYPNREWGFGTLNLYNAFLQLRE